MDKNEQLIMRFDQKVIQVKFFTEKIIVDRMKNRKNSITRGNLLMWQTFRKYKEKYITIT